LAPWPAKLPLPVLTPIIAQDEYETWPRGRIVFDTLTKQFVIYADRQPLRPPWVAQIRAHFHLSAEHTSARFDQHYRSLRTIGPP
jgi:hypothetical protein